MTSSETNSRPYSFDAKIMDDKPNLSQRWISSLLKKLLAEFVSTTILLFFGCMSCIPLGETHEIMPLVPPLGFGLAVMFNIQIFGHISGAHMNPAVTMGSIVFGDISFVLGVAYIIVQCAGAIVSYAILDAVTPMDITTAGVCTSVPIIENMNELQILVIEFLMSAALILVCCALWDASSKDLKDSLPLKIGLTVTALSLAAAPFTGAGMNPARSLGPALWTGVWTYHWVYWVGPLLGAIIAAGSYRVLYKS